MIRVLSYIFFARKATVRFAIPESTTATIERSVWHVVVGPHFRSGSVVAFGACSQNGGSSYGPWTPWYLSNTANYGPNMGVFPSTYG